MRCLLLIVSQQITDLLNNKSKCYIKFKKIYINNNIVKFIIA